MKEELVLGSLMVLVFFFLFSQVLEENTLPAEKATEIISLNNGETFKLTADIISKVISGKAVKMFGYNGMIPGPVFKVVKNSEVFIDFTNNLDVETTVHWHGVRVENEFDGVPDVTQETVKPGESFLYKLRFWDDGIFWYHPHVREDYQQELGLYGNILVTGESYGPVNKHSFLVLDDIFMNDKGVVPFGEDVSHTLMGRFGNVMLINGDDDFEFNVNMGDLVRFYITNVANTRVFNLVFEDTTMKLIGGDVGLYEKSSILDSKVISPSERYILDVLFGRSGVTRILSVTPEGERELGKIIVSDETTNTDLSKYFYEDAEHDVVGFDVTEHLERGPDVSLKLTIEMDNMMNNMMDNMMGDDMDQMSSMQDHEMADEIIEWEDSMPMMNSMSTDKNIKWIIRDEETGLENMDTDYNWKVGDLVKIRIFNDPSSSHPMQHPIHFHGNRFLILEENGIKNNNFVWKDTVLVPIGFTTDVLLEISNPGDWMVHCHIAEHLHSGMMTVYSVS